MKVLILGYGVEGKSAEKYIKKHFKDAEIEIWQDFTSKELRKRNYLQYDIIFRSPSVPPMELKNESSVTQYFFDHCPCPIIGVTATKGKGTICSFIKALLDAEGEDAYLVGNIGVPALDILDKLKETSVVVYEMSSFQLWKLHRSPHISVIGQIEPDHLNVHRGFLDYITAKGEITYNQDPEDYCVYYADNEFSTTITEFSQSGTRIPYPFALPDDIRAAIPIPGEHNVENFMAALAAVASYHDISPDEYLDQNTEVIKKALKNFKGLPHRLEFLREVDKIKYYDDNFSTTPSSTRVAVNAFPDDDLVIIVGGRDKTDNADLPELYEILQAPQIKHIILIGESGHALADEYDDNRFELADSLEDAVAEATAAAKNYDAPIVLMSPAAASFDMFENVYDRGAQYQKIIKNLT